MTSFLLHAMTGWLLLAPRADIPLRHPTPARC
jgi:hypothetical protein